MDALDFFESDDGIEELTANLVEKLRALSEERRIRVLNEVRTRLHEVSPMRHHPVDLVVWVPVEEVRGNEYNPNAVAPPELRLLKTSIQEDGYTQPVVTWVDGEAREIVDGFHRRKVVADPQIGASTRGMIPVTTVRQTSTEKAHRMASTIRHNRARGVHGVTRMVDIVADMRLSGLTDEEVMRALGMDEEEVHRLKQVSGIAEIFASTPYNKSWS